MSDTEPKYGFRCDPMEWVENDESLQGAQVRSVVLGSPKPGDMDVLNEPTGLADVDGKLWVADSFHWEIVVVDPTEPDRRRFLALPGPTGGGGSDLTFTGDAVWHFDHQVPVLIKSSLDQQAVGWDKEPEPDDLWHGLGWGELELLSRDHAIGGFRSATLLDFAEKPFPGLAGIAWDGSRLWALDSENRRICIIEKTESEGS